MRKLTKRERDYINSTRNWMESQRILLATLEQTISNAKVMIALNKETLSNAEKSLKHEQKFTADVKKIYLDWYKDNGIPEDI